MNGAQLIARERARQKHTEGWTEEHDQNYVNGELYKAAMSYLKVVHYPEKYTTEPPDNWPWAAQYWKPSEDPKRNLEKAGALIAAELDRIEKS